MNIVDSAVGPCVSVIPIVLWIFVLVELGIPHLVDKSLANQIDSHVVGSLVPNALQVGGCVRGSTLTTDPSLEGLSHWMTAQSTCTKIIQ